MSREHIATKTRKCDCGASADIIFEEETEGGVTRTIVSIEGPAKFTPEGGFECSECGSALNN